MGAKRAIVIAGTNSGVGKTSITIGVLAALRRRGLSVQPFKVGPDFIDPLHHEAAAGRKSVNLDGWMLNKQQTLDSFCRHTVDCDVAVIEGVMGLFDGRSGDSDDGSTAQIAKWLNVPVVLVVDCWSIARSAAAMVKGYREFDQEVRLAGLVLNRVGGDAHTTWLKQAILPANKQLTVLGGVPKADSVELPERHLGLHLPGDAGLPLGYVSRLADLVESSVDLDALLKIAEGAEIPTHVTHVPPPLSAGGGVYDAAALMQHHVGGMMGSGVTGNGIGRGVRIGVATGPAFSFYYEENLTLLRQAGAQLVPFNPLEAKQLPASVSGLYFGGGYPELHAAALSANRALRGAVKAFAEAGGVIYAECGGLMFLSRSVQPSQDDPEYDMAGIFPFRTVMNKSKMHMGYVEVETQPGCPIFPQNCKIRGQVYHFSEILQERVVGGVLHSRGSADSDKGWFSSYSATMQTPGAEPVPEGYSWRNVLASYVHLHFGSAPEFARQLVRSCEAVDVGACCDAACAATLAASSPQKGIGGGLPGAGGGQMRIPLHAVRSSPNLPTMGARLQQLAQPQGQGGGQQAGGGGLHPAISMPQVNGAANGGRFGNGLPSAFDDGAGGESVTNAFKHGGGGLPISLSRASLDEATLFGSAAARGGGLRGNLHWRSRGGDDAATAMSVACSSGAGGMATTALFDRFAPKSSAAVAAAAASSSAPSSPTRSVSCASNLHSYGGGVGCCGGGGDDACCCADDRPGSGGSLANGGVPHSGETGACGHWAYGGYQPPHRYSSNGSAAMLPPPSRPLNGNGSGGKPPSPGRLSSSPRSNGGGAAAAAALDYDPGAGKNRRHSHSQEQVSAVMSLPPGNRRHSHSQEQMTAGMPLPPGSSTPRYGPTVPHSSSSCSLHLLGVNPGPGPSGSSALQQQQPQQQAGTSSGLAAAGLATTDSIVSFSPAATEVLYALGLGNRLVAVTDLCDWPKEAASKPRASRSLVDTATMSSDEVESAMQSFKRSGRSPFVVDADLLRHACPSLVVAAGNCKSCDPDSSAVFQALESSGMLGPGSLTRTVVMAPRSLADVLDEIVEIGDAAGVGAEAERLAMRLRARLRTVAGAVAAAPYRPRVLTLESIKPLVLGGGWVPEVRRLAGGIDQSQEPGDAPRRLPWDEVRSYAPEVLVLAPCGCSTQRALADVCDLAAQPGWWALPAVKHGRVYIVDHSLLSRPGPRLVDGVEVLARLLHPDHYHKRCPDKTVLKLALQGGQRCRQRLLANYFLPCA